MDTEVKYTTNDTHENELEDEWLPVIKPTSYHIYPGEEDYLKTKDLMVKQYLRHNLIPITL